MNPTPSVRAIVSDSPREEHGHNTHDTHHGTLPQPPTCSLPHTPHDYIPLSQLTAPNLSPLIDNDEIVTCTSSTNRNQSSSLSSTTPEKCVVLHHEDKAFFGLEDFCLPISATFQNSNNNFCMFGKKCIIQKAKVLVKGRVVTCKSPTVFGSVSWQSQKNNYDFIDSRMVKCVNPTCKNQSTKLPKVFHFGCYMHMVDIKKDEEMKHILMEKKTDKLLDLIETSTDVASTFELTLNHSTNLILPFCGKRCFNKLEHHRNKICKKADTEYSSISSWDKDGDGCNKRSSIAILIHWLTTEENCSQYFGGIDANGRTNGLRKEGYHHQIRDIIKEENGTYRDIC